MSSFRTEEYYKRFIELQEKLRKSEEERLKLEMKFNEMVRVTREEEQMHYRKLRTQYKRFLEEDRRRQDRNERILRTLERIESRVAMIVAKTERFKLLRQQYQTFLDRIYANNQIKKSDGPIYKELPKEQTRVADNSDIVQTYLQSLSSSKLKEMLKKEEDSRARLPVTVTTDPEDKYCYSDLYLGGGDSKPNYANTIADDIMNSIYLRRSNDDRKFKESREFNNNTLTPQEPKYTGTATKYFSSDDNDNMKIVSGAENTESDDFSESDEILYKNPLEFQKTHLKTANVDEKLNLFKNPEEVRNVEQPLSTQKVTSEDKHSPTLIKNENIVSPEVVNTEVTESLKTKETPPIDVVNSKETPKDDKIINDSKQQVQESVLNLQETTETVTTPAVAEEKFVAEPQLEQPKITNFEAKPTQEKVPEESPLKPVEQPIPVSETIKHNENKLEVMQPTQQNNNQGHLPQYSEYDQSAYDPNQSYQEYDQTAQPDYQSQYMQPSDESRQPLAQPVQQYNEQDQPIQPTSSDVTYDESGQAIQQYTDDGQPIQQYTEDGQYLPQYDNNVQYDENGQIIPQYDEHGQLIQQYGVGDQQYDENGQLIQGYSYSEGDVQVQYDENGQPIQQYDKTGQHIQQYDETGQPIQQYDESGQPIQQYDESGQPIQQYDETGQPIQQYDETGQPIQQYDETGQPIQQYDESGQPIQQYDETGQPMQQYDETGQPIQQYDETGQPIQQYDETGQPIQQYDESGQPIQQYDETGQPIQQYDETGQPIQQYDETGQPIQQYDETGQPIQQYDESGQPIQQYDENGQPIQQYDDQYYMQQYDQNVEGNADEPPENVAVSQDVSDVQSEVVKEEEVKKLSNVMEMLDTDTESMKQDTKVSHDSDFDFSNG